MTPPDRPDPPAGHPWDRRDRGGVPTLPPSIDREGQRDTPPGRSPGPRDGLKLVAAAAATGALFGMLLAVLTNQGTYTPTAAYPAPRKETRWLTPPTPKSPTMPSTTPTSATGAGNTATPMVTTPHPKGPTTTAPSTSANQTATTGTSTPDPTTTTSTSPTTTTEGAAVTVPTPTLPPPPPSDESTAQSIATDVQGIGLPPQPQRGLEGVQ